MEYLSHIVYINMDHYFETEYGPITKKPPSQSYLRIQTLKRIMKIVNNDTPTDNVDLFITKFNNVSDYLKSLSHETRNKYLIYICSLFYYIKNDEYHNKYKSLLANNKKTIRHNQKPVRQARVYQDIVERVQPEPIQVPENRQKEAGVQNKGRKKQLPLPNMKVGVIESINEFARNIKKRDGKPISEQTIKNYAGDITRVMKLLNETSLRFLVTRVDDVIALLDSYKDKKARANSFYSAIVNFLPMSRETQEKQDAAYEKYASWQKGFGQNEPSKYI